MFENGRLFFYVQNNNCYKQCKTNYFFHTQHLLPKVPEQSPPSLDYKARVTHFELKVKKKTKKFKKLKKCIDNQKTCANIQVVQSIELMRKEVRKDMEEKKKASSREEAKDETTVMKVKDKQGCVDVLLKKVEELSQTKRESDRYETDLMLMIEIYKTLFG